MSVSTVTVRNESDVQVVKVQIPRPVTTVRVGIPGIQGEPGPSGNALPAIYVDHGDATPKTIYTPSSDQVIKSISVLVSTPFDGAGAKISIGTDASPELLVDENDLDLTMQSTYETFPGQTIPSGTPLKAFITAGLGSTQGSCMVLVEFATA